VTETPFIHPTAAVEPGARVGAGTRVWHHSHVRAGAVIGTGCTLGKNVFVDEGVRVGDRVKIQNNVSVYRGVELGDEVFVGPSAVFTNDLRPRAGGNGWQLRTTRVRRGASIGANATIVCGTEIGEYGMVGAGAVVTASVRPHQLVVGNPARHHGWVCACGEILSRGAARPARTRCPGCPDPPPARIPAAGARIPLAKVEIGPQEQAAVLDVMRSGMLASGPKVAEFEQAFARVHGAGAEVHAVAVSNGTVALVAALRAHGIGPGDEVITSPLTFAATLNAILEAGATARFCDITEDFTLDPGRLEPLLTPRTRAVLPVHLYGLPAAMDEVSGFARRHGLVIIQDAAQAHGAQIAGRPVGAFGTATFSLYATKNITCGEGGVVITDDEEVAGRLRLLRNQGMADRYEYVMPGSNYRLTDLQAAVAAAQLARLPGINEARARNAAKLSAGLAGLPGLIVPAEPPGRLHVWHQYTIRLAGELGRDELRSRLAARGIDSRPYYPRLVHDYACYRDHPRVIPDQTPQARQAAGQVLSLPVHPALTPNDIDRIVSCVREALLEDRASSPRPTPA
jgi:dTDP-4-amino-4,6-dideoxygalactose transaminase/acetyltransferase-like isoleucine patch superfamily enzyme